MLSFLSWILLLHFVLFCSASYDLKLNEIQTGFHWFLNATAFDSGKWRKDVFPSQKDFINSYIDDRPRNDFFELKKYSNNKADGNNAKYGLAVIELQHMDAEPIVLKFINFTSANFDDKTGLVIAGIVDDKPASSAGVEIKNVSWNMYFYKRECLLTACDRKISKSLAVLLFDMANATNKEMDVFKNIDVDEYKPILNAITINFLRRSTVDAYVVTENGEALDEKLEWLTDIIRTLKTTTYSYFTMSKQSVIQIDNHWINATPTPYRPNKNIYPSILSPFFEFIFSTIFYLFPSSNTVIQQPNDNGFMESNSDVQEEFSKRFQCRPFILRSIRSLEIIGGDIINLVSVKLETANMCPKKLFNDEYVDNENAQYGLMLLALVNETIFINVYNKYEAKTIFNDSTITNLTININRQMNYEKIGYVLLELDESFTFFNNLNAADQPKRFEIYAQLIKPLVIDIYIENIKHDILFRKNNIISTIMDKMGHINSTECETPQNESNPWKIREEYRKNCN